MLTVKNYSCQLGKEMVFRKWPWISTYETQPLTHSMHTNWFKWNHRPKHKSKNHKASQKKKIGEGCEILGYIKFSHIWQSTYEKAQL